MATNPPPIFRILIVDDEALLAQKLAEFLTEKGFVCKYVRTGAEALVSVRDWAPDYVFYDLVMKDLNALAFLRELAKMGRLGKDRTKVLVFSGHNDPANIRECMRLGASDYIAKPYRHTDVFARLILHIHPKREAADLPAQGVADHNSAQYYIHLTDLTLREALKGAPVEESLHNLTKLLAKAFSAVRVSIVKCDPATGEAARQGVVIASNDMRTPGGLRLELMKYPEISYVLNNDKLLALDNLAGDETMFFVTRQNKSIEFNSMIVAPIHLEGRVWGVVSIRLADTKKRVLTDFELRFAQLMGHVMGLVIIRDPQLVAVDAVRAA